MTTMHCLPVGIGLICGALTRPEAEPLWSALLITGLLGA